MRLGSLVKIDAYEMQNVDGSVIYTSARLINSEGRRTCKVGVVKTFFDQVELVGNRVGVVTEIAYYIPRRVQKSWKIIKMEGG